MPTKEDLLRMLLSPKSPSVPQRPMGGMSDQPAIGAPVSGPTHYIDQYKQNLGQSSFLSDPSSPSTGSRISELLAGLLVPEGERGEGALKTKLMGTGGGAAPGAGVGSLFEAMPGEESDLAKAFGEKQRATFLGPKSYWSGVKNLGNRVEDFLHHGGEGAFKDKARQGMKLREGPAEPLPPVDRTEGMPPQAPDALTPEAEPQAQPKTGSPGIQAALDKVGGGQPQPQAEDNSGKLNDLNMWANISEGLSKAGRSLAGLSGAPIPEGDDTAYGLRKMIAEEEDRFTPAELTSLKKFGFDIDPNTKKSTFLKILPAAGGITKQREALEFAGGQAEKKAGMAKTAAEQERIDKLKSEFGKRLNEERVRVSEASNPIGRADFTISKIKQARANLSGDNVDNQAFNLALTMILKGIAGEAGNIASRERDQIMNELGGQGWINKGEAFFKGDPLPRQVERLKSILDRMELESSVQRMNDLRKTVDTFKNANKDAVRELGLKDEDIAKALSSGGILGEDTYGEPTMTFFVPGLGDKPVPESRRAAFLRVYPNAKRVD